MRIQIGSRVVELPNDSLKDPAFKRGVEDCLREISPREGTTKYLEGYATIYRQIIKRVPRSIFTPAEIAHILEAVQSG